MPTSSDAEFEDIELTLPDFDPEAPFPEFPCMEHGPVTVYNYGGIPITLVTGDVKGMSGAKLSQYIQEAVASLGMSDTTSHDHEG